MNPHLPNRLSRVMVPSVFQPAIVSNAAEIRNCQTQYTTKVNAQPSNCAAFDARVSNSVDSDAVDATIMQGSSTALPYASTTDIVPPISQIR